MYGPIAYALQGLDAWSYQGTGLLYPTGDKPGEVFTFEELEWRDGLQQFSTFEFGKGASQILQYFRRAVSFQRDFGVPVHVGEFGSVNLEHLKSLPQGMARAMEPEGLEVRQIVGLSWRDGVATALLKRPIQIYLDNQVNAAGLTYTALDQLVDIQVKGRSDSPYNQRQAATTFYNIDISRPAVSRFHRTPHLTFSFKLPGQGIAPLGLPVTATADQAAQAPAIATYRIGISPELAQKHQASRVAYVRDILRACRQAGFSWGYFSDGLTPPRPDFAHDCFRTDRQGRIRALLRQAACGLVS
jgi:hypothetical protein